MTRKLKILVKNGQMLMKKLLKNGRFYQIFDKKDIAGLFNLRSGVAGFSKMCVRDFFLKNGAGGICRTGSRPRAALVAKKFSGPKIMIKFREL